MARNRKRARDRRPRQPGSPVDPRQGIPTATHDSENGASDPENGATELEPVELGSDSVEDVDHDSDSPDDADHSSESLEHDDEGAPAPLEHATPDVELAEEQLAYGRPAEPEPDEGDDEDEFEREVEESLAGGGRGGRRGGRRGGGYDDESGAGASGSGELVAPGAAVPERRPSVFARLDRLPARKLARAPTSTVAGPPAGVPGHGSRDRVRDRGRSIPRRGRLGRREDSYVRLEVSATGR